MTVILDTRDLAVLDHRQALYEAFTSSTVQQEVMFGGEEARIEAKIEAWTLGPGSVFQVKARDLGLERTEQQVRTDQVEMLAVSTLLRGTASFRFGSQSFEALPGHLSLVDMATPYKYSWSGPGGAWAFKVPYDQLGLDPPTARKAVGCLRASSLYGLVSDHVRRLAREIDVVAADPAGTAVGVATTQLIRALITSAIEDDRVAQEARGEALWPLVLAYVDAHLTEHDLSPARIASANNISPRYLYKLCARHDLRLGEWIIERRLRGARQELEGPGSRSVAAIARRWGFVDPSHFSGRFRHAYDMSPRDCRNLARERGSEHAPD